MHRIRIDPPAAVLLVLLVSLFGIAPLQAAEWPQELPTESCGDYFLVQMKMGGKDKHPLSMLLDTGAANTVIDVESLERVSGKRLKSGKWAKIELLTAGAVKFKGVRAQVRQIDHLQLALGAPLDGILGFNAFKDVLLTMDYANALVSIAPGKLERPDGKRIFRTVHERSRPFIEMVFDGQEIPILLDSGSSGGLSVETHRSFNWKVAPVSAASALKINRIQRERWARMASDVNFGPVMLKEPTLDLASGTELVGTEVMRYFRFVYDQKRRRVRIDPIGDEPVPFESRSAPGWAITVKEQGFKVVEVYEGLGASRAGVREGDLIVKIDGTPVYERDLCDRRTKPPGAVELTILRDDEELELTVERDLLVP